jgi:hypothetical protein
MAGGIDWFRWHHGSVTDPKFQLVARKAGVGLTDVIAVWAFVLEKASASDVRGSFGDLDHEAIDCLFGLAEGKTLSILEQMEVRGLVADGLICAWDKRQPKREREDDTAAERKRRQRERDAIQGHGTPDEASQSHVTPRHTTSRQKTPREEKSREEKKSPSLRSGDSAVALSVSDLQAEGVDPQHATDWFKARKDKGAKTLTPTAWAAVKAEAARAGVTVAEAVKVAAENGWQGFKASWMTQEARASPSLPINRQEALEARNKAVGDEWLRQQGIEA